VNHRPRRAVDVGGHRHRRCRRDVAGGRRGAAAHGRRLPLRPRTGCCRTGVEGQTAA